MIVAGAEAMIGAGAGRIIGSSTGGALVKMAYSSLLAGVGLAVIFSIAILGITRSSDMRRAHRRAAGTAYAALAAVGLLLSAGIVVFGLFLVAHKS